LPPTSGTSKVSARPDPDLDCAHAGRPENSALRWGLCSLTGSTGGGGARVPADRPGSHLGSQRGHPNGRPVVDPLRHAASTHRSAFRAKPVAVIRSALRRRAGAGATGQLNASRPSCPSLHGSRSTRILTLNARAHSRPPLLDGEDSGFGSCAR